VHGLHLHKTAKISLFLIYFETYFKEKWDFREVPCSSKETKSYHHFPSIDVEAAKSENTMMVSLNKQKNMKKQGVMSLISKYQIQLPYGQSINGHFCIFHVACKKNQNCVVPDLKTVKGTIVSAKSLSFMITYR